MPSLRMPFERYGVSLMGAPVARPVPKAEQQSTRSARVYLGTQLIVALMLVVLATLVHGFGVVIVTRLLRLEDSTLRAHRLDLRAFGLLISMALSLFLLHALEIGIFAFFYVATGAVGSLEAALYFSASSYATLGHPEIAFPHHWRLLGAIEGLLGFLLIGWSTAVFVTDMNKLLRK